MNMPKVTVSFTEKAATAIQRGSRGIIAMVIKDTVPTTNPVTVHSPAEIPATFTAGNKEQIELALMGYQEAPKAVIVYVIASDATSYTTALTALELIKFDYCVFPDAATMEAETTIATWVKTMRSNGKLIKAVLPSEAADTEGVINYATPQAKKGSTTYTAEKYCARIAGIIAGTPLTISCTFAPLMELDDCTRLTSAEMDTAVNAGKLIIFHDGEKVKIARGVNSFQTLTADKNNQFKKIKIVDTMDMIADDIKKTAEDSYLGKYANSYTNKCLLVSAIAAYFQQLVRDGLLETYDIGIDIEANRTYLKSKGIDTDNMSDDEIKKANTDDKVFLIASIKILDAIEEIPLPISI